MTVKYVSSGLVMNFDADNPVSYPRTGSTWKDTGTYGLTATLSNVSLATSTKGRTGLSFTGGTTSYADLNSTSVISGNNPFTLDCYYTNNTSSWGVLFGNYGSGYTSNALWFAVGGPFINTSYYAPGAPANTNGTHHICMTRDAAGNIVTYFDGVAVTTGSNAASIVSNINWRIGADVNGGSEGFNGTIWNLRAYNRVLTANEVAQNYNYNLQYYQMVGNVIRPGLIAYLNAFDQDSYAGTGTVVYDLSGNNNNFNILGNVTWDGVNGFGNFTGNSTGSGNKLQAITASAFQNLKTSQNGYGYTVCVWAKSTGGGGAWRKLIGNSDGDNYIDLYQSSAAQGYWHQDGSGDTLYVNDGNYYVNDSFSMTDSVWRMYSAVNFNGGTVTNPAGTLSIGNEPTSNAYPWTGQIGAVMIYNRVLSKQELANNFFAFNSRFGTAGSSGLSAAGILNVERVLAPSGESGIHARSSADKQTLFIGAGDIALRVDGIPMPTNKTKTTFSYSASDQSWTVPANTFYIYVKCWGSGGGGGCAGGWTHGAEGGGGGHSRGLIPVTPGEVLTIRVPRGGYNNPGTTNAPFGGGSSTAGGDNQYGAGGGGYCGIFRSTQPLLIAGGGGGGGSVVSNAWNIWNHGGAGGGMQGQHGWCDVFTYAGTGGAQGAGGTGGNGNNTGGNSGSSLTGGSLGGNPYGGGGGGGYYGGGSGSYGNGNTMAGGGGGSGYVHTTVLLGGTYTGNRQDPAFASDPDLPTTGSTYTLHAYGAMTCSSGGDGYCVIYY